MRAIITNDTNNSMAVVRERTIPTERPPLVGEVSAKFLLIEGGVAYSARRNPTAATKSGSARNRTLTSGSVVRNSDH
jgi:hypothetical protein